MQVLLFIHGCSLSHSALEKLQLEPIRVKLQQVSAFKAFEDVSSKENTENYLLVSLHD
jgi:hypothetical protein